MINKLNTDSNDFINQVEKFSRHSLNRKAEMISIYSAAIDSNQVNVFRDLCFTAKYLFGMMRVIKEGGNNPQVSSLDHVKKDFSENFIKATNQIRQIINESDESLKKYFEENFFEKSHHSLTNLNELLADLECAKLYLNYIKHNKQK